MKKLNPKELEALERHNLVHRASRAEAMVELKDLEIMIMKQRLLSVEISAHKSRVEQAKKIEAGALEVKREFVKTLTKKHKLEAGWGFDPDSGEIKEED